MEEVGEEEGAAKEIKEVVAKEEAVAEAGAEDEYKPL